MALGFKTGGREAGTPNKVTQRLREVLADTLREELEDLPQKLSQLETKERLEIIVKLLPYVLPKSESISMELEEPVKIIIYDGL
jgi:hypothetical protein